MSYRSHLAKKLIVIVADWSEKIQAKDKILMVWYDLVVIRIMSQEWIVKQYSISHNCPKDLKGIDPKHVFGQKVANSMFNYILYIAQATNLKI